MVAVSGVATVPDEYVLTGEPYRVDGVDTAANADVAIGRDRHGAGENIVDRALVDLAARADHAIHEFAAWRRNVQCANVDDAGFADDEAVRVGEVDVAADLSVFIGVEDAVDRGRRAAVHQIDEVAGAVRQNQIAGVAGADLELRIRVESV